MYIVFGNNIVDSKEMKEIIETNTEFKVVKDMSKGSKREDMLAFNLSISINALNELMEEECNINDLGEDELFEEYLTLAEELATDIEDYVPDEAILDVKAYKWDESDNDIKLIIVVAHQEVGEAKLRDVMKRLTKQVE